MPSDTKYSRFFQCVNKYSVFCIIIHVDLSNCEIPLRMECIDLTRETFETPVAWLSIEVKSPLVYAIVNLTDGRDGHLRNIRHSQCYTFHEAVLTLLLVYLLNNMRLSFHYSKCQSVFFLYIHHMNTCYFLPL